MSSRNYYMVRCMFSREDDFNIIFDNNVVAVGWSEVDFTQSKDAEQLKKNVYEKYYQDSSTAKNVVSKKLNEVARFKNIKKGDYIVVPYYSQILIAEAEDTEIYSLASATQDLSNQRKVRYKLKDGKRITIPRNNLSEGLQKRLRVRGNTVSNLAEFSEEIEKIFSCDSYSYINEIASQEIQDDTLLKATLLKRIQEGKTNLQTGGIGLEHLICEIMECEGYTAKVLPKSLFPDGADADIEAIKEDSFMSQKILVQVKHHSGYSDKAGIQQIINALQSDDRYSEYDGYFITSASIDEGTRSYAAINNIQVMDGNSLIDLIYDNLTRLTDETRKKLGVSTSPRIIEIY